MPKHKICEFCVGKMFDGHTAVTCVDNLKLRFHTAQATQQDVRERIKKMEQAGLYSAYLRTLMYTTGMIKE